MLKKSSVLTLALTALCACFSAAKSFAAEDSKLTGTVKVEKDDAGAVKKVTLNVGEGAAAVAYTVVQDDKGKEVAKHDGETCTITGTVAEKDGEKQLTVKESKAAEKPKAPAKTKKPEHPEHPK